MMCCDVLVVVLPHWSVAVRLMCEADSARDDPRDHQRQSEWPVEVPHRPVRSGSLCGECCTVDDVPSKYALWLLRSSSYSCLLCALFIFSWQSSSQVSYSLHLLPFCCTLLTHCVLYITYLLNNSSAAPSQFWVLTTVSASMIGFALVVYTCSNSDGSGEYCYSCCGGLQLSPRNTGPRYVTLKEEDEPR